MVLEKKVLRRIFGPKKEAVTEGGENYLMRSFIICIIREIKSKKKRY